MKKSFVTMLILICFISMISGCTNSNKNSPPSNDVSLLNSQNLFYGDLTHPGDLFFVFAVYNNSLLYLSLNESNEAGIRRFDMNSGASVEICRLEDYLMNPANNTVLDGILYFNYTTRDAARKMIAIHLKIGQLLNSCLLEMVK